MDPKGLYGEIPDPKVFSSPVSSTMPYGFGSPNSFGSNSLSLTDLIKDLLESLFGFGPDDDDSKKKKWCDMAGFQDIDNNPEELYGKTPDEVANKLGEGWTKGKYGETGNGWAFRKDSKMVFFNSEGRHKGTYWGISSPEKGRRKIVGSDYIPSSDDKSTIIWIK